MKRIECARNLPESLASISEIQACLYSSGPIRVINGELVDGHGRWFAIREAKGPDYFIEVLEAEGCEDDGRKLN